MTRSLIAVLAVTAASCSWSPFGIDDHRIYLCSGDTDCGDGMHCVSGRCAPLGSGTGGGGSGGGGGMGGGCQKTGAEICTDGIDNDCNGDTDCTDSDCASKRCDLALPLFCSGGMCTCTGDAGLLPAEMNCSDNKDNDCNQLTDCHDPNCVGKACSASGKVCQPDQGCTCSGNGGTVQTPETSCLDTFDNDCDGLTDCQDSDCNGVSCGAHGFACNAQSGMCRCSGNGGTLEVSEGSCSDHFDNDCDGNTDCFDSDCGGAGCGPSGMKCNGNMCLCGGNGGAIEVTEQTCNDNADNDCNGRADCGEPYCNGRSCGVHGKTCINGVCACGGSGGVEASNATCGDTVDNDCDGNTDCADTDCAGKQCSATKKVCQGTTCACTGAGGMPQTNETSCSDGFDNDCDGLTDCADPTCANMACGGPRAKCAGSTCMCFLPDGSPGMVVETNCTDGVDDDCDGLVDCHDPDCNGQGCGAGGHCCAALDGGTCVNLSTSATNCGGCGIACSGAFPSCNSGICPCGGVTGGCPMAQTCTNTFGGVCQCATASQCATGEICTSMTCSYP